MKICYLSDANSIHTKKFCKYFINKGYEVNVISLNEGEISGATVYSMNLKIDKNKSTIKKLNYLKKIIEIKKIVEKINPDIIHAHYASSYGILGRMLNKKPYIVSVWGSDIYEFPKKSIFHKNLIKGNLKKADIIMSTSNIMAKETEKYTDKKIVITPFGVDIKKFKKRNLDEDRDYIIIGIIKTLEVKYGVNYLIQAFHKVKKLNPNIKIILRIAGHGSKLEEYKKLVEDLNIENEVEFLGFINQDEVVKNLNEFDIACFPSNEESFGVAAIEAQACGVPVVVSDADGFKEISENGKNGLMFKRGNVEELVEKIEMLIKDKKLRNRLSELGRANVLDKYDLDKNMKEIENCYRSLIGRKEYGID